MCMRDVGNAGFGAGGRLGGPGDDQQAHPEGQPKVCTSRADQKVQNTGPAFLSGERRR